MSMLKQEHYLIKIVSSLLIIFLHQYFTWRPLWFGTESATTILRRQTLLSLSHSGTVINSLFGMP